MGDKCMACEKHTKSGKEMFCPACTALWDTFAGQALVGILACPDMAISEHAVVSLAFDYGAMMLAERSKRHG